MLSDKDKEETGFLNNEPDRGTLRKTEKETGKEADYGAGRKAGNGVFREPDMKAGQEAAPGAGEAADPETEYLDRFRDSGRQESSIPVLLKKINLRVKEKADQDLREWGLTISQARALHVIGIHGGGMTQKELERELGVSHPTIVGLVSRMEENGFVCVAVDPGDRRNKIVSFAEKAHKHGIAIRYQRFEIDDRLLRGMTEEEIRETERLLNIMYHNIEDWDEYSEGGH